MKKSNLLEILDGFNNSIIRHLRRNFAVSVKKNQKPFGFSFPHGTKNARVFVSLALEDTLLYAQVANLTVSCPELGQTLILPVFQDSKGSQLSKKLADWFFLVSIKPEKIKAKPFFKSSLSGLTSSVQLLQNLSK